MGLYIQMHSMHGLFRSKNLELGRDEDTGGQITYVLELAKALGRLRGISKVDIVTRRILDPDYPGYSEKVERVSGNVSIVRIECGPKKYIKKVDLWPYINEFVRNAERYSKSIRRRPDILQSNYADSGLVCAMLSKKWKVPQVHTGHSLGYPKMRRLGTKGARDPAFKRLHFPRRLKAEQRAIDTAKAIIVSTRQEMIEQYGEYRLGDVNERKFRVAPPGIDRKKFYPPRKRAMDEAEKETIAMFENILDQGVKHPERRIVTAVSRLDRRKNLGVLFHAFAQNAKLRAAANLIIFAPTVSGEPSKQKIIHRINNVIRRANLYDNVALPAIPLKYETQMPLYYRFVAERRGVFVNPALIEPFGLTIIEAQACGLPVVATKNGGPSEIIRDNETGLLINPKNPTDVARKLLHVMSHKRVWRKFSVNALKRVRREYTWQACARKYLRVFKETLAQ